MNIYKRHRFPPEIIQYSVWVYYRFSLSLCDVEDLLAERGGIVSYETIRFWCSKFGRIYCKRLKSNTIQFVDTWYMDEVFINAHGERLTKIVMSLIYWCRGNTIDMLKNDFSNVY